MGSQERGKKMDKVDIYSRVYEHLEEALTGLEVAGLDKDNPQLIKQIKSASEEVKRLKDVEEDKK